MVRLSNVAAKVAGRDVSRPIHQVSTQGGLRELPSQFGSETHPTIPAPASAARANVYVILPSTKFPIPANDLHTVLLVTRTTSAYRAASDRALAYSSTIVCTASQ